MLGKMTTVVVLAIAASLLVTGCPTSKQQILFHEPCDLGATCNGVPTNADSIWSVPDVPTGPLHLKQALAMALLHNPELKAFWYAIRAAEARVLQAAVLPNPELGVELDEYDRGGAGFNSIEMTVVLAQAFELGGKRKWRRLVAEAEGELAGWDYQTKRLDVLAETARRFTEVVAAQERLALAQSAVELAQRTNTAVGERVKAGKEPPLQAFKSNAELEMARLEAAAAEKALEVARKRLASMWGSETASFGKAQGQLDQVLEAVPTLELLRSRLSDNPDLVRREAEIRRRRAALAGEKASRTPDITASAGYRRFELDGTDALTFGIGIQLPVFDRNAGRIAAAKHELVKAEMEQTAAQLALMADLAEAHANLTAAHDRVLTLRDKVLPAMEQAYQAVYEGYLQGKFGFLEMLDAQRRLLETRAALVDALEVYQIELTEIQRLTGSTIKNNP